MFDMYISGWSSFQRLSCLKWKKYYHIIFLHQYFWKLYFFGVRDKCLRILKDLWRVKPAQPVLTLKYLQSLLAWRAHFFEHQTCEKRLFIMKVSIWCPGATCIPQNLYQVTIIFAPVKLFPQKHHTGANEQVGRASKLKVEGRPIVITTIWLRL